MQLHLIKVVVEIEKVKLAIRFPGQLSFQFKNTHLYQDLPKLYPLSNNECLVGDSVTFQLESTYTNNADSYSEVMVDLIISINTASGKIVAGVVTFNAVQSKVETLPLKRCSDKTASATINVGFAKIQKIKDIEEQAKKSIPITLRNMKSAEKPTNALRVPPMLLKTKEEQSPKMNRFSSKSSSNDSKIKGLASSKVKNVIPGIDIRLKDLQQNNERKMNMLKREKEEIQTQLQKIKEKWKISQRKQKQLQSANKELKQNLQKRRIKSMELQNKQIQLQKINNENEKKMKANVIQIKRMTQTYETLNMKYAVLERKLESKELSFVEREKRLNEKMQQLQADHSKSVHQYNLLLQKMELMEKANQNAGKLKQKGYLQQKSKWKEQWEKLQKQLSKLREQNEQLVVKTTSLIISQKNISIKINQMESQLDISHHNFETQKVQLQKQIVLKKQLEKDLEELKNIQIQKNLLKKKINQSSQEYQKLKDKFSKMTLEYQELKDNHKVMEISYEQITKQKKRLATKCSDFQKANTAFEKDIARLQSQNNNLSSKNTFLNQRLNDLKTKSQQQQAEFAEKESALLSKVNSLFQSKDYIESDLQDLKWALEKERQSHNESQKKLKQRCEQIIKQQQASLKLQKAIEQLEVNVHESTCQIQGLKKQMDDLKRRERQNLDILKQKQKQIFAYKKKINELQQEYFLSSSKLKVTIEDNKELIVNYQIIIDDLKNNLENKKNSLEDLQKEYQKIDDQLGQLTRQSKLLTITLDENQKILKEEEERNKDLKKQNDNLKKQLQESTGKFTQDQIGHIKLTSDLKIRVQQLQKQNKSLSSQLQTFKKAMQQLLIFISKDSQTSNSDEVIAVPDINLARTQLEALGLRNKYINNFKNTIAEQEVEINYLEKEVQNKSKNLQLKSEELQKIIKQNSQKIMELELKWNTNNQNSKEEIQLTRNELQNQKSEKQKIQNKLKLLTELFEQQKSEKQQITTKFQQSKIDIKKLQQKILEIRSRQINKKSQDETSVHKLKLQLNNQIQQQREKVAKLTKDYQLSQKSLAQKQKIIGSLKAKNSSLSEDKGKLEAQLQILKGKFIKVNEQKSQLQQNNIEHQKQITQLQHNIQNLKIQIKGEKQLKKETETKLNEAHNELSDLLIAKQNLNNKLESIKKTSMMSNEQQKNKIVQLEQNLNNQIKKSSKYFDQLIEKTGTMEIKQFLIKQLEDRQKEQQSLNSDLRKQNQEKRSQINKLNNKIEQLNRQIMGVQKQKSEHYNQKNTVYEQLESKKAKIQQLLADIASLKQKIQKLIHKNYDTEKRQEQLKNQKIGLHGTINELKESLSQTKKQVQKSNTKQAEAKNKLSLLQDQLKEKQEFYQNFKNKNWDENQKQVISLKQKCKQLQKKLKQFEQERQSQRTQLRSQIQYFEHEREELQQLLEQRDEMIERQQMQLMNSQNRIISLNGQLRNCLEAWEKQKAASIPSRKQASKIQQDMNKFQSYAAQLDKKTKQILNISTFKIKDQMMAKTATSLLQLLELISRSKSRALNKASDNQKNEIVKEYDRMRQKIEEILKSEKINLIKS